MADQELVKLAQSKAHVDFFEELKKRNLQIEEFSVSRRHGLHVTVDLKMKADVTEEQIRDILDEISKIRFQKAKEAKKNRRKERKAVTEKA